MNQQKIIISILGPSCSGKTTIRKQLSEKVPSIYHVAYDKQKWMLSNYDRDVHAGLIKEIVFGLFETVVKTGIPIQLEYFNKESEYEKVKEVADTYGYALYCFELMAPQEVLLARFRARVIKATEMKSKTISVTDEDIFLKNLAKGYFVPPGIPSFDTTMYSPEEICEQILKSIEI
jgi:adenylate kinase family enzyme